MQRVVSRKESDALRELKYFIQVAGNSLRKINQNTKEEETYTETNKALTHIGRFLND